MKNLFIIYEKLLHFVTVTAPHGTLHLLCASQIFEIFGFFTTIKKSSFNLNIISLAGTALLIVLINSKEKKDCIFF